MMINHIIVDQHLVQMLNTVRNGVNLVIVIRVTIASIVIHVQNNNFTRKFINRPNAMMYNNRVIVQEVFSVHLLTLNVSFGLFSSLFRICNVLKRVSKDRLISRFSNFIIYLLKYL